MISNPILHLKQPCCPPTSHQADELVPQIKVSKTSGPHINEDCANKPMTGLLVIDKQRRSEQATYHLEAETYELQPRG
jgi:hypothetical protein